MRRKRLKYLKFFSLINIFLLIFNIISYFFLTGPGVFRSQADSITTAVSVRYNAPQCSDGIDNDSDGYIDYPDDPGCSSADDDDESDHPIQPPTPPSQPTPSQGNYNPPTQPLSPPQELPVQINVLTINNKYLSDLPLTESGAYQFTDRILTFNGQIGLSRAIIFIQLNRQTAIQLSELPQIIYTTQADENGYFQWTTPFPLDPGFYEIYIWAINLANWQIITDLRFSFQILESLIPVTEEEVIPPAVPTSTLPLIPPKEKKVEPPTIIIYPKIVPKEVYQEAKEFYNLSIKVLNKDKQIFPKDKIVLKTDLIKLKPKQTEKIEIKYLIKNSQGKIVLETKQQLEVPTAISYIQNFQTYFNVKPDKYTIEARLERDNKIFIASDYFIVKEKPLVFAATELAIPQQELASRLILNFFFLLIIFIIFCLLLINEYLKSHQERHISEKDLEKDDYLDLR